MLNYGGLLKQKHKILNLDDAEDDNLINTSDEDRFCCKVKIICTSIQNYKSKYCFNSKEFC
ncbi:hypothetical protein BUY70_01590 [Staphylococcus epidermidis]|nr:hypothetical protein BUY70_01590 [Staphylococcus epidermidis]